MRGKEQIVVAGTSDIRQKFWPIALWVAPEAAGFNGNRIAKTLEHLKILVEKIVQAKVYWAEPPDDDKPWSWTPRYVLTDFEKAFINGARIAFPDLDLINLSCYFHLKQAVKRTGRKKMVIKEEQWFAEAVEDIECLERISVPALKPYMLSKFIEKWRGLGEDPFVDYFVSTFGEHNWTQVPSHLVRFGFDLFLETF